MSNFDVTVTTIEKGGIFDDPASDVTRHVRLALDEIGEASVKAVRLRLDKVLQHPTGHYRKNIDYTVRSDELVSAHDSGVIYGPWLEGTSSRNKTTRFKGYSTFRKVAQEMDKEADMIAEKHGDLIAETWS